MLRPFGKAEPFERSLRVFPEKTARSHDQLVELLLVLGDIEKVVHGPDKQFALAAVIPDQALAQRRLRKHDVVLGADGDEERPFVASKFCRRDKREHALEEAGLELDLLAPRQRKSNRPVAALQPFLDLVGSP